MANTAILSTRIPKDFGARTAAAGYAWKLNEDNDLVPSGEPNLLPGQAWTYNTNGDLVPSGIETITDDPYWEYNVDGDLVPVTP